MPIFSLKLSKINLKLNTINLDVSKIKQNKFYNILVEFLKTNWIFLLNKLSNNILFMFNNFPFIFR